MKNPLGMKGAVKAGMGTGVHRMGRNPPRDVHDMGMSWVGSVGVRDARYTAWKPFMAVRWLTLGVLVPLLLLLAACSEVPTATPLPTAAPSPLPTQTPTTSPTPIPTPDIQATVQAAVQLRPRND